jgi:hypothetical protein
MFNDSNNQNLDQVSGIFNSYDNLDALMTELHAQGINDQNVNIVMSDKTRDYYSSTGNDNAFTRAVAKDNKLPEGLSTGAVSGGLLGAVIGGLTLVGSLVVPGAGLLAAGPIVGALTGGATGAAAGGLVGALVGLGIPDEDAKTYQSSLQEPSANNVLVIAHVQSERVSEVRNIFERYGAHKVKVK